MYIIVYGGRIGRRGYAQMRAEKARYYLTELRGVSSDRFDIVQGGYREKPTFEIWLVTRPTQRPIATPSVDPRFIKFGSGKK